MTETLVQVCNPSGWQGCQRTDYLYYFNDSDSGAQGRNPCGRSGVFKYPDLACNPNLSGGEPDPNSVYPASDPSDFCMAAQDAPFPSACRKAGEKSDEQK